MKNNSIDLRSYLPKIFLFMVFLGVQVQAFAQEDPKKASREAEKYMQQAEEARSEGDFASAEAYYRRAIAKDPGNAAAKYNLGNLYYYEEINHEAVERHSQAAEVAPEKPVKHISYHNQGNAFMKQNKYKEAIEAYKNALRNDPGDDETRYNLALAKKMLEEEEPEGGGDDQNEDQNQDQEQNEGDQGEEDQEGDGEPQEGDEGDDQENEDQKGDEGEEEEEEEEGKPQDDQNQEQEGENQNENSERQQPVPGQLSPQQVKNLLEAMGNEEKKVQDKINAEKAKGAKTRSEKDW